MTTGPMTTHPTLREVHRRAVAEDRERAWSRAVSADIRRRVSLVARLDTSERSRRVARLAIADPVHGLETFVRDFVWTYDPRNRGATPKDLPLLPWPKQVEFLRWLQAVEDTGDDGVVDKSRDVGVTWLVVAYYVWRWLTVPGWAGAIGSRKADLLDRLNDPKSVFWKVEYVIRMLPPWLRPVGFEMRKHRSYARIVNPETNATITGEAGPEMGRGGRSSLYFLDEFGVMPRAVQVRAAVADNARSVLYASTATGADTEFYRIVHDDGIPHFRLSWQHDPRKGPEWREDYIRRYGPAIAAREVDIDYSGGGDDVIIPADWVRAAIGLDFGSTLGGIHAAGLDVADAGDNETVYLERRGPTVISIESWRGRNPVDSAGIVAERATASGVELVRFDCIGVGAGVAGAFNARDHLAFRHIGVNVGDPATETYYPDAPDREARERFANLKAELWWNLRLRFWNSFRFVQGDPTVDPSECVSIPDDPKLIAQLSMPRIESNERGLLRVESKDRLRKRGVTSPDRADALVLAFADVAGTGEILLGFV